MLREVTRLTKGDFSKFKEKRYQVRRITFGSKGILLKADNLAIFENREKAMSYINELDKRSQDEDCYFRVKEVN